ncbi:MAG TPA: ABC transporter permease [Dermatophilaceae bacterium]|jgi:ABC-2 type transport system permease protein|nr:ABC transporter permease [Dermatophilaceae bacterium]
MGDAMWAEAVKALRSRLPWVTVLAFTVAAGVGGLFMFILQDPQRARSLGLLGAKAQLASGTADWPTYLALLAQTTAVGGLIVFGLVTIWVFGREFTDHTAKDLLALPTSRTTIIGAKFAVTAAWCLALSLQCYLLGLVIGAALRLPQWSADIALHGLVRLLATAAMTVLLAASFALAASLGRGYLAAIGLMFLAVFLAQVIAILGYGQYFPYSVPSIYSGLAGTAQPPAGLPGYALVVLVGLGSVAGTAAWWRRADQSR